MTTRCTNRRTGFTMVEVLLVIGILGVLMALLLTALFAVRGATERALSMSNLRQSFTWMQQYSDENRGFIVPAQFDYSANPVPGRVRSNDGNAGNWSDILWTNFADASFPNAVTDLGHDYSTMAPDAALYRQIGDNIGTNPMRSATANQRGLEQDVPGYFAANMFFDADPNSATNNGWWSHAQIVNPTNSMYLIDSWVGPTILGQDPLFSYASPDVQVDFRYQGEALILLLDGNVRGESDVLDLQELEQDRGVRVRNLNQR